MTASIDLNSIRDIVHQNQREGLAAQGSPSKTIVVDQHGRISTADILAPGEDKPVTVVEPDIFHTGGNLWTDSVSRLAESLDGEVVFLGRRVWQDIPMAAAELRLPGGLELLLLAVDSFPATPPLAFVTENGECHQVHPLWDLAEDAPARLDVAIRRLFHGTGGAFRSVFGPAPGIALTEDSAVAGQCGWQRFFSASPLVSASAEDALHARAAGLLSRSLSGKKVLISGVGSGGSYVAEQLVRAGVGSLALIDPDSVEAANLSRTTYRWEDVGQPKVLSLARHLRSIRPDLRLDLHPNCLGDDGMDALEDLVRGCDLLLALTDDPSAQSLLNHAAYIAGRPAVFAGLYAGARGGEAILCVPESTPCYRCATGGVRERMAGVRGGGTRDRDYGVGRLAGETALAADIHHLDSATVKLALSLLLTDEPEAALGGFAKTALEQGLNYLCLSMVPDYWFFPEVFGETPGQHAYQGVWLATMRDPECPVCGDTAHRITRLQCVPASFDLSQFDSILP